MVGPDYTAPSCPTAIIWDPQPPKEVKLHPNAIENLSGQNQIWPQILTKVWQVFFVKDHLLGKMFDQNQMKNHILEHFSI